MTGAVKAHSLEEEFPQVKQIFHGVDPERPSTIGYLHWGGCSTLELLSVVTLVANSPTFKPSSPRISNARDEMNLMDSTAKRPLPRKMNLTISPRLSLLSSFVENVSWMKLPRSFLKLSRSSLSMT